MITRPQPYTIQVLQDLFKNGELLDVADLWIEPTFGAVARVSYQDGAVRVVQLNDVGVNASAAVAFVKDKGHTRVMLDHFGYKHPSGVSVLLPWWAQRVGLDPDPLGPDAALLPDAGISHAASELGFPVFVKSAHGSLGRSVWRCDTAAEVAEALNQCERRRIRVAVIEQAVDLPDYRLFVLDGDVPIAYERMPLMVHGDGQHTVGELFAATRESALDDGRPLRISADDSRIERTLQRQGLTARSVVAPGQKVRLLDVSNLSTGGGLNDVSEQMGAQWVELAIAITQDFGLRCCGVDIACADITGPVGEYAILELNGTPGLDHYAFGSTERDARARAVLARIFASSPAVPPVPSAVSGSQT